MGRDYAPLLDEPAARGLPGPTILAALRAAAALQLWAGQRPRLFRRLLERDTLAWHPATLGALAWAAWAEASPGSLRFVLRSAIRGRDLLAGCVLGGREACEWRFAFE
jgi:hypothetical protein